MKPSRPVVLLSALLGGLGLVVPSCREPTQIEVEIRTLAPLRCSELRTISIVVARNPEVAEDNIGRGFITARPTCANDDTVGTLVITPSESRGALIVAAAYGQTTECRPPAYENCIVARRRFSFVDHVPLRLKVALEVACVGVPCTALTSCKNARCESSEVACQASGECELSLDGGTTNDSGNPDGATETVPDGSAPDGSAPDGSAPGDGGGVSTGTTNACPLAGGDGECGSGQVCCGRDADFACVALTGCFPLTWHKLACTGKKACASAAEYCCLNAQQRTSGCAATCANGPWMCASDDDCPQGKHCDAPGVTIGPYALRNCQP